MSSIEVIPCDQIAIEYYQLQSMTTIDIFNSQHVKHSEGSYRDEIIAKVLYMCSKEKFSLVTDFAWYTSVLLDLAVMQGKGRIEVLVL